MNRRQPPSTFTTLVVSDHTQVIAYCLLFTVVNESYLRLLPVFCLLFNQLGWLGSRVVSVLDSVAEGPGFKSQPRQCRVTVLGKLFTPIVPLFTKQRNW